MKVPHVPSHPQNLVLLMFSTFGHSERCIVMYLCFNLNFPDMSHGALTYKHICYLYIPLGEKYLVRSLVQFFKTGFLVLLMLDTKMSFFFFNLVCLSVSSVFI